MALKIHDIRPYYTCPRCLGRVLDPRFVPVRWGWRGVVLAILGAVAVITALTSSPFGLDSEVGLLLLPLGVVVAVMIARDHRHANRGAAFRPEQKDRETDTTEPDMSLVEACASRLSVLRTQALARGVADCVTFCLHPTLIDSSDKVQDTMRRYRDPLRVLGVPSEIVTTDVGPALCGAGKPEAAIGMLATFTPDIELSSLEDALATRPAEEWFLAAAIQPRMDAVEMVIAQVSYGGDDCRLVACLGSGRRQMT